jgi:riboflavin synthase
MFTGIVTDLGIVTQATPRAGGLEVVIGCHYDDLVPGESVAVNGACLTVENLAENFISGDKSTEINRPLIYATFYLSPETLGLTNLGLLKPGFTVNLERALASQGAQGRLSGHMVQGHVDGLGTVISVTAIDQSPNPAHKLVVRLPDHLLKYVITKGSICIDGISLTINSVRGSDLEFMIIPHTWQNTNLKTVTAGYKINIETDLIGKYIERLMTPWRLHEQHT